MTNAVYYETTDYEKSDYEKSLFPFADFRAAGDYERRRSGAYNY